MNVYKKESGNGLLGRAQIDEIYRAAIAPYEIWPMSDIGASRLWMRKSLLFDDPLYLVNYLYATVVAAALYDKAQRDPNFVEKYNELLRHGFTNDANQLLNTVGIDLNDTSLVEGAIDLFRSTTDQLRAAYASAATTE
jgi:oligoendopeptidase F